MNVEEAIKKRRAIRKYLAKEVPDDLINELMEAARWAPSAYNVQPWKFFIVKDEAQKQKLKENNVFKQPFVYDSPLIILCCADPDVYPKDRIELSGSHNREVGGGSGAVRDLAFACQNLVLRATELGLGTCYIGLFNREKDEIKKLLNIPQNYILTFTIIAGYPAESPNPTPRKKIEEIIINH